MKQSFDKPDRSAGLYDYRQKLGLTLRQLAKLTQISPATLHRIEKGHRVSARSRVKLQDGLGLKSEEIDALLNSRPGQQNSEGR